MKRILFFLLLLVASPAYADLINVRLEGTTNNIIQYQATSTNSPAGEQAPKAFDGSPNSKYLNFDKQNMGVGIKLNTGRPVSAVGFMTANDSPGRDPMSFTLYGSNDGVNWTALAEHQPTQVSTNRYTQSPITYLTNTTAYAYYFIRFPTMRYDGENSIQIGEIQLLYDSTNTATSTASGSFGGFPSATAVPSSYPTVSVTLSQTNKIAQTSSIVGNSVYLDVQGSNNSVTIEQFSRNNAIGGINGAQSAKIAGSYNTLTINQGTAATPLGQNLVEMSITGNTNTVSINQQHNSKYAEVVIGGSSNFVSLSQKDAGGKSAFVDLQSNFNTVSISQEGAGNHFFQVTNAYGGSNVSVTQAGQAQKLFSLTINSPNVGVVVSQTNATTADSAAMTITCTTGSCNGYSYTKN